MKTREDIMREVGLSETEMASVRRVFNRRDWLDDIEAQADETSPYYLPRLIAEIRRLRALVGEP
jgi:hypothetical protein